MPSDEKPLEQPLEQLNPNKYVPSVMAIGTWLFVLFEAIHGIHYVPDEWILGIILAPWGGQLYLKARDRFTQLLNKRDDAK